MDGVALCARFSIATNRLDFCGPPGASPTLYEAVVRGTGSPAAREALARFEALMPYLEAIGHRHGLDPFDRRVVEAYWVGNELLDDFPRSEFRALLEALSRRGLPRSVAERLQENLPEGAIPHHAFHVAFVGVGAVTGHVETTLPNMESCRPALARVELVADESIMVRHPVLGVSGGRLALGAEEEAAVPRDARALPDLAPGDAVALHWGWAALKLEDEQSRALSDYTDRSLASASRALPGLDLLPRGGRST